MKKFIAEHAGAIMLGAILLALVGCLVAIWRPWSGGGLLLLAALVAIVTDVVAQGYDLKRLTDPIYEDQHLGTDWTEYEVNASNSAAMAVLYDDGACVAGTMARHQDPVDLQWSEEEQAAIKAQGGQPYVFPRAVLGAGLPRCTVPPADWLCTRAPGHDGPCAAWPMKDGAIDWSRVPGGVTIDPSVIANGVLSSEADHMRALTLSPKTQAIVAAAEQELARAPGYCGHIAAAKPRREPCSYCGQPYGGCIHSAIPNPAHGAPRPPNHNPVG